MPLIEASPDQPGDAVWKALRRRAEQRGKLRGCRGEVNGGTTTTTAACERKSVEVGVCKRRGQWSIAVARGAKDSIATNGIKSGVCVGNFFFFFLGGEIATSPTQQTNTRPPGVCCYTGQLQ